MSSQPLLFLVDNERFLKKLPALERHTKSEQDVHVLFVTLRSLEQDIYQRTSTFLPSFLSNVNTTTYNNTFSAPPPPPSAGTSSNSNTTTGSSVRLTVDKYSLLAEGMAKACSMSSQSMLLSSSTQRAVLSSEKYLRVRVEIVNQIGQRDALKEHNTYIYIIYI